MKLSFFLFFCGERVSPSDEEDQDHHVPDVEHLSTTPDKGIKAKKMTHMSSHNYPDTVYPNNNDFHGSAVPAKQTKSCYDQIGESEASRSTP